MAGLVEVKNLKTYFKVPSGFVHAVDDVNMTIQEGKTMGVVGESGCGKTTLGRTIIHLEERTSGQILFEGEDYSEVNAARKRALRERAQIIFQDPFSSLNPRMTNEQTITEPLKHTGKFTKQDRKMEAIRLMELVGIDERLRGAYPHELDGGRRQRVVIARALAMNPKFIVCDEPVSALDVSIQAQVINLLLDLQEKIGLTYMFITHDLSVVRYISDDISVMYLGKLVETCGSDELFEKPLHPYTKALFSAIPSVDIHNRPERILIKGELSSPINPAPGCRFAKRCTFATERCREPQILREVRPGHFVSCCRVEEINRELLQDIG